MHTERAQRAMTLDEWALATGVFVGLHESGAKYVHVQNVEKARMSISGVDYAWELFHLADHVVSSNSAGTYWLVER